MRNSRLLFLAALLAAPALYSACSDDDDNAVTNPDAGTPTDSSTGSDTSTSGGDSSPGSDGGINRGPATLDFDPSGNGDPISMVWSTKKNVLYIADNNNDQIWTWSDADGFEKAFTILADPAADDAGNTDLGQIVELSTGEIVVPRFGFGTVGNILYVDPTTGDAGAVPGIDAGLKRTALTADPADALWGGYFTSATNHTAVVTQLSLTTGETDYATGFGKPVGVLVLDNKLLVSDQTDGIIYSLPLDGTAPLMPPYDQFATVPSTDALTAGPNGSVITGQFRPATDGGPLQVRQAFGDGGVAILDAGVSKPQGVAYDKTNKRLFVADSNGTTLRTIKILPLE